MHRLWCGALAAVGTLALAGPALASDVGSFTSDSTKMITDFSAQVQKKSNRGSSGGATRANVGANRPVVRTTGGGTTSRPPVKSAPRVGITSVPPRAGTVTRGPVTGPRVVNPGRGGNVSPIARVGRGPAIRGSFRSGPVYIGGRPIRWVRGPHYRFWQGRRYSFVPLAVISGFTLGAVAYSAAAYVPVEAPYCSGVTEDGCEMRWQEVPTVEGPPIAQCVAFCPAQ